MTCPKCGKNITESKFCPECGASLAGKKIVAHAVKKAEEPETKASPSAAPSPVKAPEKGAAKPAVTITKNKKPMIILVAVILILAISVAGVAGYVNSKPQVKIANAFENTLFDASSFDFKIEADGISLVKGEGFVDYGDSLTGSNLYFFLGNESYQDAGFYFVSKQGEVLTGTYGLFMDTNINALLADFSELARILGLDITAESIALLKNGAENINALIVDEKINEKAIEVFYDADIVPFLADIYDVTAEEIPLYDEAKDIFYDFLDNGLTEDAMNVIQKLSKDGIENFTLKVDIEETAKCIYNYIVAKEELSFIENSLVFGEINPEEFRDLGEIKIRIGVKGKYLESIEFQGFSLTFSNYNEEKNIEEKYNTVAGINENNAWKEGLGVIINSAGEIIGGASEVIGNVAGEVIEDSVGILDAIFREVLD